LNGLEDNDTYNWQTSGSNVQLNIKNDPENQANLMETITLDDIIIDSENLILDDTIDEEIVDMLVS
jgi:hypothetical protein